MIITGFPVLSRKNSSHGYLFQLAHLAIPLIKRLYVEEHHLVVGAGHNSVVLAPRHEYNLVAKIPFAVSVPEIVIYPSDFITTKKIMRG